MLELKDILKELNCTRLQAEFILNNQNKILSVLNKHPNSDYFCNQWDINHIIHKDIENIENGYDVFKPLSIEEVQACKNQIMAYNDENNGITWDTIDYAIETIKEDRIKNIMKDVNYRFKYIGCSSDWSGDTWSIGDNIVLWDASEEVQGQYWITEYSYTGDESECIRAYKELFKGTIEQCMNYLKGVK